jgi:hypothetical protein
MKKLLTDGLEPLTSCNENSQGGPKNYPKSPFFCTTLYLTTHYKNLQTHLTNPFQRVRIGSGYVVLSIKGPCVYFSYNAQCILVCVQVLCSLFNVTILPAQYYYRYRVLKDNNQVPPTACRTFLYFLTALLPPLVSCILAPAIFVSGVGKDFNYEFAQQWYEEVPVPQLIVGSIVSVS